MKIFTLRANPNFASRIYFGCENSVLTPVEAARKSHKISGLGDKKIFGGKIGVAGQVNPVFVGTIALIADDQVDIRGISFGVLMGINPYFSSFQFVFKLYGCRLIFKTGDDNSQDIDPPSP